MLEAVLLGNLAARLAEGVKSCDGIAAIAVVDLATGGRIGINDELPVAVASSIKVAILTALCRAFRTGQLAAGSEYVVEAAHHVGGSGVLQHFEYPVRIALKDLASLMIVLSDNTATNLIIDLVGMEQVNRELEELGLGGIQLRRKMIDSAAAARGDENTATMRDAAQLMRKLWAGEIVDRALCDDVLSILRKPKRQSPVALLLPGEVDVANKPGDLEGVSCEFAIINLERRPYVFCCAVNYAPADDPAAWVAEMSAEVYRVFDVLNRSTAAGRRLPMADLLAGDDAVRSGSR